MDYNFSLIDKTKRVKPAIIARLKKDTRGRLTIALLVGVTENTIITWLNQPDKLMRLDVLEAIRRATGEDEITELKIKNK